MIFEELFINDLGGVRFGIDSSTGNYGYKKVGADTIYPFSSRTIHTGTYTFASGSNGSTVDLGEEHTYRYVNASNVFVTGQKDISKICFAAWFYFGNTQSYVGTNADFTTAKNWNSSTDIFSIGYSSFINKKFCNNKLTVSKTASATFKVTVSVSGTLHYKTYITNDNIHLDADQSYSISGSDGVCILFVVD